jgi:hypothetical protein
MNRLLARVVAFLLLMIVLVNACIQAPSTIAEPAQPPPIHQSEPYPSGIISYGTPTLSR